MNHRDPDELRPPVAKSADSLDSSRKLYEQLRTEIHSWQEELWVFALNSELELLDLKMIFRGSADSCPIHPRDIFRFLILNNASFFALAHNHPSGHIQASKSDREITERLFLLSKMMEIPLIDHLILGRDSYFSFADNGCLNGKTRRSPGKNSRL